MLLEPEVGVGERDEVGLPLGELRGESPIHCIIVWRGALPEFFFLLAAPGQLKDADRSSWSVERERRIRPPMTVESSPAGAEEERSRPVGMLPDCPGYA